MNEILQIQNDTFDFWQASAESNFIKWKTTSIVDTS